MSLLIKFIFIFLLSIPSFAQTDDVQLPATTQKTETKVTPDDVEETSVEGNTEINVRNADILSLVRIFSKKTKRNYILDERVKGTVSIYLPGKISADEAIHILDSVLALKGFTPVPIGDNIWKIIPANEAKQTTIPTINGTSDAKPSAAVVTRFINLKYVNSDDVKQLLTPLISSSGLINAYTGTNSLIIIDSEENITRLIEIINNLDIPYTDRDLSIIPVEHAEAKDIAEKIKEILLDKQSSDKEGSNIDPSLSKASLKSATQAVAKQPEVLDTGTTVSARSREPKIIADERTNSIVVVADEDSTAKIKALISQLDSPVDLSGDRFYVYRCQHASAEDLAEVLSGLTEGGSGKTTTKTSGKEQKATNTRNRNQSQQRTLGQSRDSDTSTSSTTSDTSPSVGNVKFSETLSITADPSTNSLVITGTKQDYEKIKGLLEQLDIKRRQVLVEAVILEVAVKRDEDSSVSFLSSIGGKDGGVMAGNNIQDVISTISNPASLSKFTVAAASSGTLKLPNNTTLPTQTAIVEALSQNDNVNILSAPTIIATDNEEAEIVVGQNVPFLASTASSEQNLNNVFNQIDRQDVGITLRLTPQINSSDFVTLKLFTEVSDVLDSTSQSALGPTTTIRTSQTTVISKDSQMVVIGGLISDSVQDSSTGIPYLQDIPFLGAAFRSSINQNEQRNLLIFITPRIIKDQFDARDTTRIRAGETSEIIDHYGMTPDREGILASEDIDNVAESEQYQGDLPGTILPPVKKEATKSKGLNLSIKPKLPSEKTASSANARFMIFKIKDKSIKDSPFAIQSDGLVAIEIPNTASNTATDFFSLNSKYLYNSNDKKFELQLTGKFTSAQEAAGIYPLSDNGWYVLSPYEILNLGKNPWIKP